MCDKWTPLTFLKLKTEENLELGELSDRVSSLVDQSESIQYVVLAVVGLG